MIAVDRKSLMLGECVTDARQAYLRYRCVQLFGIEPKTIAEHRREQSS